MCEGVILELRDAHFLLIIKRNGSRGRNAHFKGELKVSHYRWRRLSVLKCFQFIRNLMLKIKRKMWLKKGKMNSEHSRDFITKTFFSHLKLIIPLHSTQFHCYESANRSRRNQIQKKIPPFPLALLSHHREWRKEPYRLNQSALGSAFSWIIQPRQWFFYEIVILKNGSIVDIILDSLCRVPQ